MPKVIIVILNWDDRESTLECLASLRNLEHNNCELVVVDNGSEDGSPEAIREQFPDVTLLQNKENLGAPAGRNVGIRYAMERGAEYLWLLDNDNVVEPDTLSKLIENEESRSSVGMVSPMGYHHEDPTRVWFAGGRINWETGRTHHLGTVSDFEAVNPQDRYLPSFALLVRKEIIKQIGLFDERFFPIFYEDTDLSVRCTQFGYQLAVSKTSKVYQKISRSSGGPRSERFRRLLTRARFYFMEKYRDRFGRRMGYHRKFIAGCVEDYVNFLNRNSYDEAQGVLNALIDIYQGTRLINNPRVMQIIQRHILYHPYFWANVIRGDWATVISSLRKKVLSIPSKVRHHRIQQ